MNTRARATRLVGDGDQAVSVRGPIMSGGDGGRITRFLGKRAKFSVQPPGGWVKPEHRSIDKREQLNNRVAASCMGLFMSDHHREAIDGPV